jgi:GTPase SAR1 family protein
MSIDSLLDSEPDELVEQDYASFLRERARLGNLIGKVRGFYDDLELPSGQRKLDELSARVLANNFKVLVMGEFSRGKSTLINAMLGESVLPTKTVTATAVITEVRWGAQPAAWALKRATGDGPAAAAAPVAVPVEEISTYGCIPTSARNPRSAQASPWDKLEVEWPLELCRDGVMLIDSPGLNDIGARNKMTLDYLPTVDAVVFVMTCKQLGGESELDWIEDFLESRQHTVDVFFVCTHIDLVPDDEREEVIQRAHGLLDPLTGGRDNRIFMVNALGGLQARLAGDDQQLERSGLPALQNALRRYLASSRGSAKIVSPSTELGEAIRHVRRTVPQQLELLGSPLQDIQNRYATVQNDLRELELRKERILRTTMNTRKDLYTQVHDATRGAYLQIADSIAQTMSGYEAQRPLSVWEAAFSDDRKAELVRDITAHISGEVVAHFEHWQHDILDPLLEHTLETLGTVLDRDTCEFEQSIGALRPTTLGESGVPLQPQETMLSPWQRLLGVAAGAVVLDPLAAGMGAAFGAKEALKAMGAQLALAIGATALLGWHPVGLAALMIGGAAGRAIWKRGAINRKIIESVSQHCENELRATAADRAAEVALTVDAWLSNLQTRLETDLQHSITEVEEQYQTAIKDREEGESRVAERRAALETVAANLDLVEEQLGKLVRRVLGPRHTTA